MTKIIAELPIKTASEGNCSQHWTKKRKRHKQQQFFIRALFNAEFRAVKLPCEVKMIRLGPRLLDVEENLPMAFKWIKDEVSECLIPEMRKSYRNKKGKLVCIKGRADSDPRIKWTYAQEKSKIGGIRIEIEF